MLVTSDTWADALESGRYPQIRSRLRSCEGYCVLGVGTDLTGLGTWDLESASGHCYRIGNQWFDRLPGPLIANQLGLTTTLGRFYFSTLPSALQQEIRPLVNSPRQRNPEVDLNSLSSLNDNGVPFHLLAQVIRARPSGLFVNEE